MEVAIRVVVGALLAAHGLVHLFWFVPNQSSAWPFSLTVRWLPEAARRSVALGLVSLTIVTFVLLALAVWGLPALGPMWPGLALAAAVPSLLMLVVFWNGQLIAGVVIDVALLAGRVATGLDGRDRLTCCHRRVPGSARLASNRPPSRA